jgi:tetratricopeptide (TPR) repeat protein
MADNQRIEDLRRRVQKDPASIAFAQLAEECRRAAQFEESVEVCRAGLAIHPGYLSARVTLGRALIELNQLDDAQVELELVLRSAPENLAAIRGLAEIHHRRGSLGEALAQYRAALALARNDPDLQQTVAELERAVEPPKPPASADGLSFEQAEHEFLKHLPPPPKAPVAPPSVEVPFTPPWVEAPPALQPTPSTPEPSFESPLQSTEEPTLESRADVPDDPAAPAEAATVEESAADPAALQTLAALEQWLDAIHVARTQPRA